MDHDWVRLEEEEWAGPPGEEAKDRKAQLRRQDHPPACGPSRLAARLVSALPKAGEGKTTSLLSAVQVLGHAAHIGLLLFLFWCFCGFSLIVGSPTCLIVVNHSGRGAWAVFAPPASCQAAVRPPWLGSLYTDSCGLESRLLLLSLPPGSSRLLCPELDTVSEEDRACFSRFYGLVPSFGLASLWHIILSVLEFMFVPVRESPCLLASKTAVGPGSCGSVVECPPTNQVVTV